MIRVFTPLALLLLTWPVGNATAQPVSAGPAPVVYAGGGVSIDPGVADASPYLSPGLGVKAPTLVAGIGMRIVPRVALALEVSTALRYSVEQSGKAPGGTAYYTRDHRDLIVGAVARVEAAPHVLVVAGAGFVDSATSEDREDRPIFGPATPVHTTDRTLRGLSLIAGLEGHAPLGPNVRLAPSFRYYLFDHDEGDVSTQVGLRNGLYRFALLLEVGRR
jgi:hypothetical protein